MIETKRRYCAECGRGIDSGTYCARGCCVSNSQSEACKVLSGVRLDKEALIPRVEQAMRGAADARMRFEVVDRLAEVFVKLRAWPYADAFGLPVSEEQERVVLAEVMRQEAECITWRQSCAEAREREAHFIVEPMRCVDELAAYFRASTPAFKAEEFEAHFKLAMHKEAHSNEIKNARMIAARLLEQSDLSSLSHMRTLVDTAKPEYLVAIAKSWGAPLFTSFDPNARRAELRAHLYADTAAGGWLDLVALRECGFIRNCRETDEELRARISAYGSSVQSR